MRRGRNGWRRIRREATDNRQQKHPNLNKEEERGREEEREREVEGGNRKEGRL